MDTKIAEIARLADCRIFDNDEPFEDVINDEPDLIEVTREIALELLGRPYRGDDDDEYYGVLAAVHDKVRKTMEHLNTMWALRMERQIRTHDTESWKNTLLRRLIRARQDGDFDGIRVLRWASIPNRLERMIAEARERYGEVEF